MTATRVQLDLAAKAGHLDERTLTGRRAQARTCPTCRQRVLVGDDNHVAALTATVNPTPLTLPDEALALAAGRRTYTAQWYGQRAELRFRSRWCYAGKPTPISDPNEYRAGLGYTVHVEHACNATARINRAARKAHRNG